MSDTDLAAEIERLHETLLALDRDLAALKEERDRRKRERRQRELDENEGGVADEELDT
jgi:hypothetical protein